MDMNKTTSLATLTQTILKIDGAYAPTTIRAYKADFLDFIRFCEARGECALPAPPLMVAEYIEVLSATKRTGSSIKRAVTGIASIHNLNQFPNPSKHPDVMLGLRRMFRKKGRYKHQVQGITKDMLDEMLASLDDSLRSVRDRALLMIAYDCLCRRSEIVTLRVEDISTQLLDRKNQIWSTVILLRQSKTDLEDFGKWLPISKESAHALNEWLGVANLTSGYIFRSVMRGNIITDSIGVGQIARIYKRIARDANLENELVHHISSHSMRVGAAQDLLLSGASLPIMMNKGRWSKPDTVMRYVEKVGIPI